MLDSGECKAERERVLGILQRIKIIREARCRRSRQDLVNDWLEKPFCNRGCSWHALQEFNMLTHCNVLNFAQIFNNTLGNPVHLFQADQ